MIRRQAIESASKATHHNSLRGESIMQKKGSLRLARTALAVVIAVAVTIVIILPVSQVIAAGNNREVGLGTRVALNGRGVGPQEFVPGEIIVKFKETASTSRIEDLVSQQKSDVLYTNPSLGFKRVKISEGRSVPEMVETFKKNPLVEYAEPNYIDQLQATVNDPYFPLQWHLENPVSGSIHVGQAWDLETGRPDVIVAVVDSGVAYENYGGYTQAPDLAQTNFVFPHDSVDGDGHPNDDDGHGTHVTGTIAQSTNNGLGVAGVAYGCSIMPIRSLGPGGGSHAQFADAFTWAADHCAEVINYSGGGPASITKQNACQYAYEHGVTICAASGNDNGAVDYPAAYDQYCIAVGATRYDETRSNYSNYGPQLDVVAPGGDTSVDQNSDGYADGVLQQTYNTEGDPSSGFGYWFWQGTSMATPHVSGVAALYISRTGIRNPDAVRNQLQTTAKDLGTPGRDDYYGYGLINAYGALPPNPVPTTTSLSPASKVAGQGAFTLTVNGSNFVPGSVVQWNNSDRITHYRSATRLTADITAADIATAGTASVTVFNSSPGGGTSTPALTFTIHNPPTVSSIKPNILGNGKGNTSAPITIYGTDFVPGSKTKVMMIQSGVLKPKKKAAKYVVVSDDKTITCNLVLTSAAAGAWDVVVTNPDGGTGTLTGGLTVTPHPVITRPTTPFSGKIGTSPVSLTLIGNNYQTGATVKVYKIIKRVELDIPVTIKSQSATAITCDLDLTSPPAVLGSYKGVVTNPDGGIGTFTFKVTK